MHEMLNRLWEEPKMPRHTDAGGNARPLSARASRSPRRSPPSGSGGAGTAAAGCSIVGARRRPPIAARHRVLRPRSSALKRRPAIRADDGHRAGADGDAAITAGAAPARTTPNAPAVEPRVAPPAAPALPGEGPDRAAEGGPPAARASTEGCRGSRQAASARLRCRPMCSCSGGRIGWVGLTQGGSPLNIKRSSSKPSSAIPVMSPSVPIRRRTDGPAPGPRGRARPAQGRCRVCRETRRSRRRSRQQPRS